MVLGGKLVKSGHFEVKVEFLQLTELVAVVCEENLKAFVLPSLHLLPEMRLFPRKPLKGLQRKDNELLKDVL